MRLCRFVCSWPDVGRVFLRHVRSAPRTGPPPTHGNDPPAIDSSGRRLPVAVSAARLVLFLKRPATLAGWIERQGAPQRMRVPAEDVKLLVPIPRPNKLFLLAGNYAEHIREGGGVAAERAETFPYVFMKPPTTTLTDPGQSGRDSRQSRRAPSTGNWSWRDHRSPLKGRVARPRRCSMSPATRSSTTSRTASSAPIRSVARREKERSSTGCTASGTTASARAARV